MFSSTLDKHLIRLNITRTELARRIGVKPQYIMNVLNGRQPPFTKDKLDQVCGAIGLSDKETAELHYEAAIDRLGKTRKDELRAIQDYRAQYIDRHESPTAIRGTATCPHCSEDIDFSIEKGEVFVSGRIKSKAKIK